MKKIYSALTIASSLLSVSSFAGPPDSKQTVPPPPPPVCGTGWYFGLDGGANVYQDLNGDHDFGVIDGDTVTTRTNHHVGGYGGIKFGYTFGQGPFRWGLEEDYFYNGVNLTRHVDVNGVEVGSADTLFNTAAFMTNAIFRYAPNGGCGLQPYILGGVGGWWGETGDDINVTVNGINHNLGGHDNGGFAFQAGAGVDYYFSPKWSVFTEYKFLDYTNAGGDFNKNNVGQHLVGSGFRFHF